MTLDLKISHIGVWYCVRDGCKAEAVPASGFCGPCLAWLRHDTDHDPLAAGHAAATRWGMA